MSAPGRIDTPPRRAPANPYVFIVGCPRSGTTLVQRMVNAHGQLAVTPETHWIPRLYAKPWALTDEGLVTAKLVRRLLAHPKFIRLGLDPDDLAWVGEQAGSTSYAELVSGLFDGYGRARGKPLVGDKTPDYVRALPTLHHLWPGARFVHVIRDGRDVALSMMEWDKVYPKPGAFRAWNLDRVQTAAVWWEMNVRQGRQAGSGLGDTLYLEMRYESLVDDPAQQCRALCDFLDLPYDEAMLGFHERARDDDPGLDKKRAGLPVTAGLRSWRSAMSATDLESFEAAAGDLLDELGYGRVARSPSVGAAAGAARVRSLLTTDPLVDA